MEADRIARACEALPLFPLPRVVLMPGDLLPLHVFEPRYRALVAHVAAGERLIGIATLKPGFEADYYGRPPIWPELGVGLLVSHQPLPDGRSNIVLQHVGRARLVAEIDGPHPFRVARARACADVFDGSRAAVEVLRAFVAQLGAVGDDAADEAQRIAELPDPELVDQLARRLLEDPDDRRRYVGLDRVADRAAFVQGAIVGRFAEGRQPVGEA